tara:strand:- start:208 stop:1011 length:804 start_codon:yes stop_codon:yes gene_type:complete
MLIKKLVYCILFFQFLLSEAFSKDYIIVQSTTSTQNSGLLDVIEIAFEKDFQIDVRFISVGTGQAIENAKNGDGDALLVHSEQDEINFINEGYGVERFKIMYNDFIIIGPVHDPSELRNAKDIIEAMQKLALGKALFLSRNDNSGTYYKELSLWRIAGIEINKNNKWYLKNGLGMGMTLNMASEMDAYTITDRATWLSFNKKKYLKILFENDQLLHNSYGFIVLNPKKFPHVQYENSMIFLNWLLSPEGKSIINEFKIYGQQLFFTY